jgi:cbb3-type cytochrome oxidase cytochrome c subunit
MKKSIFSAKPAYKHLFKMRSFHAEMTEKMEKQRMKVEEYNKQKAIQDAEENKYKQEQAMKQQEMKMKQDEMNYKHSLMK